MPASGSLELLHQQLASWAVKPAWDDMGDPPNSWMVYFRENPMNMILNGWFRGAPIFGNPHLVENDIGLKHFSNKHDKHFEADIQSFPTTQTHIAAVFSPRLTLGAKAKSMASSPAFLQLIQASRASSQHRSAAVWPGAARNSALRSRGVPASHSGSERHLCTGNSQQCRSGESGASGEFGQAGIHSKTWRRPRIQQSWRGALALILWYLMTNQTKSVLLRRKKKFQPTSANSMRDSFLSRHLSTPLASWFASMLAP